MSPSFGSRCSPSTTANDDGTMFAATAETPIPAATAATSPLKPRHRHAVRYDRLSRSSAASICKRLTLGAG